MRITILQCLFAILFIVLGIILFFQLSPGRIINIAEGEPVDIGQKVDPYNKSEIELYITQKAIEYGVNPAMALWVARKESGNFNPEVILGLIDGDMKIFCSDGSPVRARGLWQVTKCHHPSVPDSVTYDIEKSTEWAMTYLKTHPQWWTTWKIWKQNGGL